MGEELLANSQGNREEPGQCDAFVITAQVELSPRAKMSQD